MPDSRTEAEKLQKQYYGKPDELTAELIRICLIKTEVVYYVFLILDWNSTYEVGFKFLARIANAGLLQLTQTQDGLLFCKRLYEWLMTSTVIGSYMSEIMKLKTAIAVGEQKEVERLSPRKLSDVEMDYYANYNEGKDASKSGPKKPFKPEVCWQLPRQGSGFVVYSPDDLDNAGRKQQGKTLLNDKYGYDQIGTKETIDAMIRIAREWIADKNHTLDLEYGDISRPGGINTPDHDSHNIGKAFDIRLQRKNNSTGGFTYKNKVFTTVR